MASVLRKVAWMNNSPKYRPCIQSEYHAVDRGGNKVPIREILAELEAAKCEGEKDYNDMRQFQMKFIEADQERIQLRTKLASAKDEIANLKDKLLQHWEARPKGMLTLKQRAEMCEKGADEKRG